LIKSFKEKANAKRNFSEKFADFMTSKFGSMTFIWFNAVFFGFWFAINNGEISGIPVFDPYPFGLLTVIVSLEAIFLTITVLISQNRASKLADFREEVAIQIDTVAEEEITKIIELQIMMLKKQGVDVSNDPKIQEMLETGDAEKIEKELEKQLL
jgi:uncharacterized membrane protein